MAPNDRLTAEQLLRGSPVEIIRKSLLEWWDSVGHRHFPWRETRDPFKLLVAEILLHRTRADQIVPLYQVFLDTYPDIHSIAQSSPEKLAKLVPRYDNATTYTK